MRLANSAESIFSNSDSGGIGGVIGPGWVDIESSLILAEALGDESSSKQQADKIPIGGDPRHCQDKPSSNWADQ